mmetsp:Transcript_66547/g.122753  ORF Transcript_66547/g.122753 Transcript_66547/m.122753 type:complete len:83 (-) Transcript_66547:445-693(-)
MLTLPRLQLAQRIPKPSVSAHLEYTSAASAHHGGHRSTDAWGAGLPNDAGWVAPGVDGPNEPHGSGARAGDVGEAASSGSLP